MLTVSLALFEVDEFCQCFAVCPICGAQIQNITNIYVGDHAIARAYDFL